MTIEIQRIYDHSPHHGYRVLVDRLWPRGISKTEAALDDWWKDLAPSNELRTWFDHDENRWAEFRTEYLSELRQHKERARGLLQGAGKTLVLLYGAKDEAHNQAVVLREYLNRLKV